MDLKSRGLAELCSECTQSCLQFPELAPPAGSQSWGPQGPASSQFLDRLQGPRHSGELEPGGKPQSMDRVTTQICD